MGVVMKKVFTAAVAVGLSMFAWTGPAQADQNPSGTGQPSQQCQDQPSSPGNASSAPGSPYNSNGTSGSHYAGTQPQNSNNPNSNSQYDVSCYQVSH
jgi:hypothetical protein